MKKLLLVIISLSLVFFGYKFLQKEIKANLGLNAKVAAVTDELEKIRAGAKGIFINLKRNYCKAFRDKKNIAGFSEDAPVQSVELHLIRGSVMSAKLIKKTSGGYEVEWKGDKFFINSSQIKYVEYKTQKETEWPYKNDVVIRKTNGVMLDGEITDVAADRVTVSFKEGGGSADMDVKKSEIEYLLFAPVYNKESEGIEKRIKAQFPKMKFYREGNITLVTDSYITWVNLYKKTLRNEYTEIYFKFFRLLKGRRAKTQNFVVVFDDFADFAESSMTDGVPFWAVLGYFNPTDKVLYLFNAFGDRVEKMVFDIIVGRTGKSVDKIVEAIKKRVDERYHIFIDGQVKEYTDRYWAIYSLYKGELTEETLSTLRHEFAHELFSNWGVQDIMLSRPKIDKEKIARKKKEFLETKDYKKKEELLEGLMKLRREEVEGIEMEASESWLSEGLATYCGTDPIGSKDDSWLFIYQDAARNKELNPIEFFTSFKMGSFPGLCHKAALVSYAQSWAFTTFLMARYPDQFLTYQQEIAAVKPGTDSGEKREELKILLKCLNKDLPALEKEFADYMNTYKKVDDPYVAKFIRYHDVWTGAS